MKKRNFFALFLALALLTCLFAGCGGQSASSAPSSAGSTAAETTPDSDAAAPEKDDDLFVPEVPVVDSTLSDEPSYHIPISEEPLTYSIWMTYAPFAADLVNTETMEGMLVLDKLQEITNIHFDVTAANGAAEQDNFNLMIAAGDYCDILSSMDFYGTGLEGAVEEGIVQDLADVLPEKCPIYWSYLSENPNTLMRAYTDSGFMPAICILYSELGQEVIGPVLRQDWLEEFGMDMPTTFDELYTYLDNSKTQKNAIFDMVSTEGLAADLALGLNLNLSGFEVIDGQVEYGLAQDAFKDYLTFMNRLYTAGIISQDFFSETSEDLNSKARLDFGLGTNSLVSVGANNTSDIIMNVGDDSFEMAVMPYVSLDGTTENHLGPNEGLMDTMKDTDPWCFSTECKDIDPLLEMVEYLFSDEGYLLANYGVEGETYTMVDGEPQYTDLIVNNPDGLSYFFASYVYATNAASGFFPYINDMTKTFYDFNDNQWQVYEDLKGLSDCAYNYPSYATMTTEEAATYNSIESDLSTYTDSRVLEFITGAADIETEFDAFVDTLYEMGLQDMVDIKQAAYDRAMQRMEAFTAA